MPQAKLLRSRQSLKAQRDFSEGDFEILSSTLNFFTEERISKQATDFWEIEMARVYKAAEPPTR
ncbi:MAG: hypothetical protein LIO87_03175 [Eubacterium sp.]|nr:hypothetical protein [Eubacterium sp.]